MDSKRTYLLHIVYERYFRSKYSLKNKYLYFFTSVILKNPFVFTENPKYKKKKKKNSWIYADFFSFGIKLFNRIKSQILCLIF